MDIVKLDTESDTFFRAYLVCALWSSVDEDGDPMDDMHTVDDIPEHVQTNMREECLSFIRSNAVALSDPRITAEQAGHDFWLTRNGHGAGFWDRGLGHIGTKLTKEAKVYGSCDLYVGDDGNVYAGGHEHAALTKK